MTNEKSTMRFFHGTTTILNIKNNLSAPCETGKIQEKGRKKNLDRVFFTTDLGSARIYAGRAVQRFGGFPVIFEVEPCQDTLECLNGAAGTSVYMAASAKIISVHDF